MIEDYLDEMEYLAYVDLCLSSPVGRMPMCYEDWRKSVDSSLVESTES